jgi:hypothetical protein
MSFPLTACCSALAGFTCPLSQDSLESTSMILVLAVVIGASALPPSLFSVSHWAMCSLVAPPGRKIEYSEARTKKLIADAEVVVWVTGARTARPVDIREAPVSWLPADAGPPDAVAFDCGLQLIPF